MVTRSTKHRTFRTTTTAAPNPARTTRIADRRQAPTLVCLASSRGSSTIVLSWERKDEFRAAGAGARDTDPSAKRLAAFEDRGKTDSATGNLRDLSGRAHA